MALAVLLVVAVVAPAAHGHVDPSAPSRVCAAQTDPAAAAVDLYGAGAELVRTESVAGLDTALVLEPRIVPGTRRRMIAAGGGWCDAATGFNYAWHGGGSAATAAAAAAAYASLAAAPYFDDVTVTSTRTRAGAFLVTTHAATNGIEAAWVIVADSDGVKEARWTATGFGVRPLVAEIEGLTALPGASETYTRLPSGVLAERRGLPTAESARALSGVAPEVPAVYEASDGMKIRVSVGDSRVAVDPGMSTGVQKADLVQETLRALEVNYEQFLAWGLEKGWTSDLDPVLGGDTGWIYLNDALSLVCLACVFVAEEFQIHLLSEVGLVVQALGFTGYKDPRKAYMNVIGHEMFHNFQNAYELKASRDGQGDASGSPSSAYTEGTARFQEALHSYADVSYAPHTLFTGNEPRPDELNVGMNHCNGYAENDADAAFAAGPFPKAYNACYFWTSWYNQNGFDAFIRLITEAVPAHAARPDEEEGLRALAAAAPHVPVADQLAFSARSALTGQDKTVQPPPGGSKRDWGTFLFTWKPPVLTSGQEVHQVVSGGGVLARSLRESVGISNDAHDLVLYEVRASPHGTCMRRLPDSGSVVHGPARGESAWIVGVNPTFDPVEASVVATPVPRSGQPAARCSARSGRR